MYVFCTEPLVNLQPLVILQETQEDINTEEEHYCFAHLYNSARLSSSGYEIKIAVLCDSSMTSLHYQICLEVGRKVFPPWHI